MSHFINTFLSAELTCIPHFMDGMMGKCYNNAAGNALTWVFVMWTVLHVVFVQYLEQLLKKMQFKTYRRKRLVHSLWYSGFYGTGFLYCAATIARNNMSALDYRKALPLDGGPVPPHIVLGLGLFGSFFWHSFLWELWDQGVRSPCLGYLVITLLPLFAYVTRRIELYLSLLALVSMVQFIFNAIRIVSVPVNGKKTGFMEVSVYAALGVYAIVHIFLIPALFIVPLLYNLVRHEPSLPLFFLATVLTVWWAVELFYNPLHKLAYHWVYHGPDASRKVCPGALIDCVLFGPRDDVAFNLQLIRKEMKERQEKLISKRKPKNRGMLIQTLKCMVAIKRKLNKKRGSESSESSESESERDRAERDEGSDEDSSSEENSDLEDDEKREAKEYKEETARALLEDRETPGPPVEPRMGDDEPETTDGEDGRKED